MKNVSDENRIENQNTNFVFNNIYLSKLCLSWDNVENFGKVGQAIDDNMAHYMLYN
jgi:hypothetical protein